MENWLGYCTHASILFPTWHRVYLLLIEVNLFASYDYGLWYTEINVYSQQQATQTYMQEILGEFPQTDQIAMQPALDAWRFPYWDWALRRDVKTDGQRLSMPSLFKQEEVEVMGPMGLMRIPNPLYRYKFPLNSKGKIDGFSDIMEDEGKLVPVGSRYSTISHRAKC